MLESAMDVLDPSFLMSWASSSTGSVSTGRDGVSCIEEEKVG